MLNSDVDATSHHFDSEEEEKNTNVHNFGDYAILDLGNRRTTAFFDAYLGSYFPFSQLRYISVWGVGGCVGPIRQILFQINTANFVLGIMAVLQHKIIVTENNISLCIALNFAKNFVTAAI